MTLMEALHRIDTIKPNTYNQAEKIKWLSTLDGIIKTEIIDTHEGGESVVFNGYAEDADLTTILLVPAPYDEIYLFWLESKIDYWNGEVGKYNNSISMYNEAYSTYKRYYNRTHKPLGKKFNFFGKHTTNNSQASGEDGKEDYSPAPTPTPHPTVTFYISDPNLEELETRTVEDGYTWAQLAEIYPSITIENQSYWNIEYPNGSKCVCVGGWWIALRDYVHDPIEGTTHYGLVPILPTEYPVANKTYIRNAQWA
jgi:hypothetical protein